MCSPPVSQPGHRRCAVPLKPRRRTFIPCGAAASHDNSLKIHHRTVSDEGAGALVFRIDSGGGLIAFAGNSTKGITIAGRRTEFANGPVGRTGWAPAAAERRLPVGVVAQILVRGIGEVRLPAVAFSESSVIAAEGPRARQPGRVRSGAVGPRIASP